MYYTYMLHLLYTVYCAEIINETIKEVLFCAPVINIMILCSLWKDLKPLLTYFFPYYIESICKVCQSNQEAKFIQLNFLVVYMHIL